MKKIGHQKNYQKEKEKFFPIVLVFLLFGGAFYFFNQTSKVKRGQASVSKESELAEQLVNKHLFLTSQQQYLQQKKVGAENNYMAPELGYSILSKVDSPKNWGVDHSPDRFEANAVADLNRYPKQLKYNHPDQLIQGTIVDEDKHQIAISEYQKDYARKFVENARANGYEVTLSDDLVVTGVKPVRERMPNGQEYIFEVKGNPNKGSAH